VEEHGRDWSKIAMFFEGRDAGSVRKKYVYSLSNDLKKGKWNQEENEALFNMIFEGIESKISLNSETFGGRLKGDIIKQVNNFKTLLHNQIFPGQP
jgi:hypothetical protein